MERAVCWFSRRGLILLEILTCERTQTTGEERCEVQMRGCRLMGGLPTGMDHRDKRRERKQETKRERLLVETLKWFCHGYSGL
jgi:hypothetical protein